MKNKILFTQDVNGERAWLQSKFPGYTNLETHSAGQWTMDYPKNTNQSQLFEIAYSDNFDFSKLLRSDLDCVKSFYSTDPSIITNDNKYWGCANSFVSTVSYQPFQDKLKFWVLHIARTGTVFVETLLSEHRTKHRDHRGAGSNDDLHEVWQHAKSHPDVALVLVYRPNLWETFTSTALALHYGYHHSNEYDWSTAEPITVNVNQMLYFRSVVISTLNFWCNLRSLLPEHSFLLLNASDMINRYQDIVNHKKVNYNKPNLIANYKEAQELWFNTFDSDLSIILNNCIAHLSQMHCKQNLDHLI